MTGLHATVGLAVIAANLAAGSWGAVAWLRKRPSSVFWYLLRAAQLAVIVQVAVGFALVATGRPVPGGLHLVYGLGPLVVTLVTEAMRAGAAQHELAAIEDVEALGPDEQVEVARRVLVREIGILAVGALLIVTLALRAYFIGSGG